MAGWVPMNNPDAAALPDLTDPEVRDAILARVRETVRLSQIRRERRRQRLAEEGSK